METPLIPTSLDHRLREGLARVGAVMRSDHWLRAREAGMNPAQMAILEALEGRENGLSVKEIALNLGVSQPSATDSINALERKGAVVKRPVSGDKRAVTVCITDAGRQSLLAGDATDGAALETTRSVNGRALSPHDFWRSGAFTARDRAGSEPHLASGLLQHQDEELVDENYNLASSLEVADLFGGWIDDIAGS